LVKIVVSNPSPRRIDVGAFVFSTLTVYSRSEGTPFSPCSHPWRKHPQFSVGLAPHGRFARTWPLFWNRDPEFAGRRFAFPAPGKYQLKIVTTLFPSESRIASSVVEIVVKEPAPADAPALEIVKDPVVAEYLQYGSFSDARGEWMPDPAKEERAMAKLKELAKKYPKSPYADHANYHLAQKLYYKQLKLTGPIQPRPSAKEIKEIYGYCAAVSPRVKALRLRAAELQLHFLYGSEQGLRAKAVFDSLKKDLSAPGAQEFVGEISGGWENLAWKLRAMEILYVEDERLDRKLHYRYTLGTRWGEIFKALSDQTGLRLDMDPASKAVRVFRDGEISGTLREYMFTLGGGPDRYWDRRGDAWFLVVKPPPEPPKPPEGEPKFFY